MSLLGFNAVGRLALGQIPTSAYSVLTASAGSYAEAGQAALFRTSFLSANASFSVSGNAALFKLSELAAAGAFAETGNAAIFSSKLLAASASYSVTGSASLMNTGFSSSTGFYVVTGNSVTLRLNDHRVRYLRASTGSGASYWKGRR